jgi:hypothetical protein
VSDGPSLGIEFGLVEDAGGERESSKSNVFF